MLLKTCYLLLYFLSNVESEFILFQHQTVARDFKSSNRNATGVQKSNEYRDYRVLINTSCICV